MITAFLDVDGAHERPSSNPKKERLAGYVARLSFCDEDGRPITDLDPAFCETGEMGCLDGEACVFVIRHPQILTSCSGVISRAISAAKNMGAERLVVRQHPALRTPKFQDEYDLNRYDHLGIEKATEH